MGIERLQPFVRFCNVCGLIPFRMVLDEVKRFKRFEGHWRHPGNWWFTLLLVGYILSLILLVYINLKKVSTDDASLVASLKFVHLFAFALYFTNFIIICSLPRLFLLRFRNLENALEIVLRIDGGLNKLGLSHATCTTQRRTVIGVSLICSLVRYY
jgi:hypothetical protein